MRFLALGATAATLPLWGPLVAVAIGVSWKVILSILGSGISMAPLYVCIGIILFLKAKAG